MTFQRASEWIRSHRSFAIDLVRIYLGIGLLIKGVFFLIHPDALASMAGAFPAAVLSSVPYIHMVGGALLAAGLLTRIAALAQMPVVAGALVVIHLPNMMSMRAREAFEFSSLTLFLLALIAVWGAGRYSLDHRLALWQPVLGTNSWLESHNDLFLDLIRAYLGVGLFVKGFYILGHESEFQQLIENTGAMPISLLAAAHYIIPVHFVGGIMLLLGLATRWAALAQIPLLVGAIFYVYLPRFATLELRQNLEFTGLVLFLLCVVALYGAGRYSLDYVLRRSEEREHLHDLAHAVKA